MLILRQMFAQKLLNKIFYDNLHGNLQLGQDLFYKSGNKVIHVKGEANVDGWNTIRSVTEFKTDKKVNKYLYKLLQCDPRVPKHARYTMLLFKVISLCTTNHFLAAYPEKTGYIMSKDYKYVHTSACKISLDECNRLLETTCTNLVKFYNIK